MPEISEFLQPPDQKRHTEAWYALCNGFIAAARRRNSPSEKFSVSEKFDLQDLGTVEITATSFTQRRKNLQVNTISLSISYKNERQLLAGVDVYWRPELVIREIRYSTPRRSILNLDHDQDLIAKLIDAIGAELGHPKSGY